MDFPSNMNCQMDEFWWEHTRERMPLPPENSTFLDFIVLKDFHENKRTYLEQVISRINERKASFLMKVTEIERNIEEQAKKIEIICKTDLAALRDVQIQSWNKQLDSCREAMKWLDSNLAELFSKMTDFETMKNFYNNKYLKDIGFVEAGEILTSFSLNNFNKFLSFPVPSERSLVPKFIIGRTEGDIREFCRPWGICSDSTGRILVSDRSNHRIRIFTESGVFLLNFGRQGSLPGELCCPAGITVDNQNRIIVADKDNHRIQVFSYLGHFLFKFGNKGAGPGEFNYPWDVTTNSVGNIAVSDTKNNRIQLFNSEGAFIAEFGSSTEKRKKLFSPRGLSFLPSGELLFTDFESHQLGLLDKNFVQAETFGSRGDLPKQFCRPQGVTNDSFGKYAVADSRNYRIQIFDKEGNLLKVFGTQGTEPGQFDRPQGICFHPNGSLLVVEFGNDRVQVF